MTHARRPSRDSSLELAPEQDRVWARAGQLHANGSSPMREQLEDAAEVESLVDQRVSAEPEDQGQPRHEPALDDCRSPCTPRVEPEKDEEGCDARLVGTDATRAQAHRSADACQREDERRLPPP